jgi:leader peptidase (prepilin peptidase)/N-methyltransferase
MLVGEWALHLIVGVAGLWLSVIDVRSHRLPNIGNALTGFLLGTVALVMGDISALGEALGASALGAGFFALLAAAAPRGLGWGDVKLQAVLGFYLGWFHPVLVVGQVMGSFVIGGFLASGLVLMRMMSVKDHLPFGPCMIAATWLMVLWGKFVEII